MATVTSEASAVETLTPAPTSSWLKNPLDPTMNVAIERVAFNPIRPIRSAAWAPVGRDLEVITRGGVLGASGPCTIRTRNKANYDAVIALLTSLQTLLLQPTHPEQWYVEPVESIQRTGVRAQPTPDEAWPTRHLHELVVPLKQVAPP